MGSDRGLASRQRLITAGVHRNWIGRQVAAGRLWEPAPGVLSLPDHGHTLRDRLRVALFHAGPDAALTHHTAAYLWGLAERPGALEPIRVAVPHGHWAPADYRNLITVRQRVQRTGYHRLDLPVVPADEAVIAMAADLSIDDVRLAALEAVRLGLVNAEDLLRGPTSVRPTTRLLAEEARAGALSGGEAKYWRLLKDAGLPLPRLNAELITRLGRFRIDALWHHLRLGAEIDGRSVHAKEHAFEADRARQNGYSDRRSHAHSLRGLSGAAGRGGRGGPDCACHAGSREGAGRGRITAIAGVLMRQLSQSCSLRVSARSARPTRA